MTRAIPQTMLLAAPAIAVGMLLMPAPSGLSAEGWTVAAVCVLMGLWWISEAVPLAATALIP